MTLQLTNTYGCTPLLSLQRFGKESGALLLAKQESRNPAGSVKCRIAVSMIEAGIQDGSIKDETVVIEPTSGNTGIGLAFVCAAKGLRLILTMPESMSLERRMLLKHLGAELVLTPAAEGIKGAIAKAEELTASTQNSFMPDQFSNPANPEVHRTSTAEEIWHDTKGNVDFFCCWCRHRRNLNWCGRGDKGQKQQYESCRCRTGGLSRSFRRKTGTPQNPGNWRRFYSRGSQHRDDR